VYFRLSIYANAAHINDGHCVDMGEYKVKIAGAIWLILIVSLATLAKSEEAPSLKLVATVPLPSLVGDLEFFAADLKGSRLFLCAEDSKTVEVFDLLTGRHIHTITGFGKPHGIAFLPKTNELVVSDGGRDFGRVDRVSASRYAIVDRVKLPDNVDEALFDPVTEYFYVESGPENHNRSDHLINIIDTKNFRLIGQITIRGKESSAMAVDHATGRLYVNNSLSGEISVVDMRTNQVVATWPLPGTDHLNGLAFDEADHRLFSASRTPGKFWALDTETGKIVSTLPCVESNDNLIYDRLRRRIFITGNNFATVIQQVGADQYRKLADVPTGYRAKTSLFVPELNRLYVALSGRGEVGSQRTQASQLAIKVYEVNP